MLKILKYLVFYGFVISTALSCQNSIEEKRPTSIVANSSQSVWFRQAQVHLGHRIKMFSPTSGIAIDKGRGENISGHAYRFHNGKWMPFYDFPYSDYPSIAMLDSNTIWTMNHLVHKGDYRPVHHAFSNDQRSEIPLPKVMWDEIDYVMWKGLAVLENGTAWIVGQQGNIIYYDGAKWKKYSSPLVEGNRTNLFAGDLNDIAMLSPNSGWAVGRGGIILRFMGKQWEQFSSPTKNNLRKISMVNEDLGWSVGEKGTILRYDGKSWNREKVAVRATLTSVKALDSTHVWIVGGNSTLLMFDGIKWSQDQSIQNFDDFFLDLDIVLDSSSQPQLWLIGNDGIYTTSQTLGFSFTDITEQASLRRTGRAGIFFDQTGDGFPDLFVLNEGAPNLLYKNNHYGRFAEIPSDVSQLNSPPECPAVAMGDVNNDGYLDIFELLDQDNFRLYLGKGGETFRDFTDRSGLAFHEIEPGSNISARFIDFDNDGNLDLYVSNYNEKDMLFHNDGAGRFDDVFDRSGIIKLLEHRSYGVSFSDFNSDGLVDMLIPYQVKESNKIFDLFLNEGNFQFRSHPDSSLYWESETSPSTAVCITKDFNNDGFTDIFVYHQKVPPWMLINNGKAAFRNVSEQVGFTIPIPHPVPDNGTINAADVNNDGWIDIGIGGKLFLNSPQFVFSEISRHVGVDFIGTPSFADFDNDGDMDMFIGSSRLSLGKGDRAALFRNNLNIDNYIKVNISGDKSNRSAIGAKVFLQSMGDTRSIPYQSVQEIGLGSTPMALQNISQLHFGANPDYRYSLKVVFPSGVVRMKDNIAPGSLVEIAESSFLQRITILVQKSIFRTLKLLEWNNEIPKLIVLLFLLTGLHVFAKKTGLEGFVNKWYVYATLVILYGICIHFTVMTNQIVAAIISLGSVVVGSVLIFINARILKRRQESQYISHYKLLELLGEGGMGKVFKAIDINTKQIIALKVLNSTLLNDLENRKRFTSEGNLLRSFSHPYIVKAYEIAEAEEHEFIAMEYLTRGTLKAYLEESFPLSMSEFKRLVMQICEGMSEIHSHNIIHRDIKTSNIMLDADRNIRIMDFGLSKSPHITTMTSLGTVMGTLGFVAPEQITNINIDHRADIFSFGVVLYELLTRKLPFKGENEMALIHSIFNTVPPPPSTFHPEIPQTIDEIVDRCLAKDPSERYSSMDEIRLDFEKGNF